MNEIVWIIIEALAKVLLLVLVLQLTAAASVYLERKVSAFIQIRS